MMMRVTSQRPLPIRQTSTNWQNYALAFVNRFCEALARFADRRSVSPSGSFRLGQNNIVANQAELRRIFARWARFLRNGLDNLRQLPEIPQPDAA